MVTGSKRDEMTLDLNFSGKDLRVRRPDPACGKEFVFMAPLPTGWERGGERKHFIFLLWLN